MTSEDYDLALRLQGQFDMENPMEEADRLLAKKLQADFLNESSDEDDAEDVKNDELIAKELQSMFDREEVSPPIGKEPQVGYKQLISESSSIVDASWELTDPNPDIHALFLAYNDEYFDGRLAGIEVKWSQRMTLCAGLCCYEGHGGMCSVRLSLPLLKLRPRKDLVQTLLHEMIHAYLFVTANNRDRDGHGEEFHKHMHRINKKAGTKITVYHSFHDEVALYKQHWWRCDGPCQHRHPFFGYVKRCMNRAPAPRDTWWDQHKANCDGVFIKIKEPEKVVKPKATNKRKGEEQSKNGKKIKSPDIRNFFTPPPTTSQAGTSKSSTIDLNSKVGGANVYTISGPIRGAMSNSSSTIVVKPRTSNVVTITDSPTKNGQRNEKKKDFKTFGGKGNVLGVK